MASGRAVETAIVWADGSAETVAIRGTFGHDSKQWWTQDIPLRRVGDGYRVVLALEPGRYEFKYVVDGGQWRVNSSMYEIADDGHGNSNNVLVVVMPSTAPKAQREHADTALSIDDDDEQSMEPPGNMHKTHNASEHTRLLATGPNGTKLAVSEYSAIRGSIDDDEDRSSHTADGGEERHSPEPEAGSSSNEYHNAARGWSTKRVIVGTLVLILFGLLGAASALFYE